MLSIITIQENDKWDQVVRSFSNYDIYYLSNYVKAFEIHGDGAPILFFYNSNELKAINVVMKRDISADKSFIDKIPSNTIYDIITPYGYGGFLLSGDISNSNIKKLDDEYMLFCNENNIVSEFVRFHPLLNNHINLDGMYDIVTLGKTVTIYLHTKEQVWNELIGKNRNMIRKAKKSGVKIYWGINPLLINEFTKLYNTTMDRDNATDYYYFKNEFYKSILYDMKYNCLFFYAEFENTIISMSIIIHANNKMHYHLSASNREFQHLAPTNLLLYEAACWGVENGFETFHLGGGLSSQEDNLYKFKASFNKNPNTTFIIGKKIFNHSIYNDLIKIRKNGLFDDETSFFPKYRG